MDLSPGGGIAELRSGGDGSPASSAFLSNGRAPAVITLRGVSLAPGATLEVAVEYEARFLKMEDFPPDPNYGFDMPPAQLEVCLLVASVRWLACWCLSFVGFTALLVPVFFFCVFWFLCRLSLFFCSRCRYCVLLVLLSCVFVRGCVGLL